jgi:diguanylate cyclase (GGDEF)-like protein
MPRLGTRLYLAIDAGPIYDDAGNLIAVVETLRDMTIQRQKQVELEQLANRDGLTGIANRRTFDETLQAEWRRAMRDATPLSLLMVDVDYFKSYNDSFGHQAGDECLRRIAGVLANSVLRASDLVARYGGEEFAIILPNVDVDGAKLLGQRIRASVEQLTIPLGPLDTRFLTVSIGASATKDFANATPAQLLGAADNALYEAKRSGRNQVVAVSLDGPHESKGSPISRPLSGK